MRSLQFHLHMSSMSQIWSFDVSRDLERCGLGLVCVFGRLSPACFSAALPFLTPRPHCMPPTQVTAGSTSAAPLTILHVRQKDTRRREGAGERAITRTSCTRPEWPSRSNKQSPDAVGELGFTHFTDLEHASSESGRGHHVQSRRC